LQDLFDPQALERQLEEQLDPVPPPDRVLSPADARVRGMFDALAGRPGLFRGVCEADRAAVNCLAAVEMNVRRFHTPGFSNFEGLLENPHNIEWLKERFSELHEFSATQLEAYAQCPFRFLLEHVLKKEPPADPGVETDFGRRGTLVHDVLAELHRILFDGREKAKGEDSFSRGEEISRMFHELLEKKLQSRASSSQVQQALERIEQRLLTEWGVAYGGQWDEYVAGLPRAVDAPLLPAKFETAFGTPRPGYEPVNEPAAENLPALVFGDGPNAVRVGGRIDRIDVGEVDGCVVYTVIDYKTGRRSGGKIDSVESGRKLQLALYALAVARLEIAGPAGRPWHMGYWHVKETGFAPETKQKQSKSGEPLPMEDAAWDALVETLDRLIPRLAGGIRAGVFAIYNADDTCTSGCPYNTICRVAQIRALPDELGKTISLT
jgi:RecB family exonuclease